MKTKLALILSTSFLAMEANAATLFSVVDPSGSPAGNRNLADFTIGQEFTVGASDLLVTALGYEDTGADGLAGAHDVGIWNSSGTLIASVIVPAGTGTTKIEAWRYQSLVSAVTLTAGETYRIGGGTSASDPGFTDVNDAGGDGVADFAISADASVGAAPNRFAAGVLNDPVNDGTATPLRWAAGNMEYTVIPEPASVLLLGFASFGIFLRRR